MQVLYLHDNKMASYYSNKNITADAFFGQLTSVIFSEGLDKAKEMFMVTGINYDPNLDTETAAGLVKSVDSKLEMVSLISSLDGMPEHVKKYVNSPEIIEAELFMDGFQKTPTRKIRQSIISNNNPRSNYKSRNGSGMGDNNSRDNRYKKISGDNRYSNKNETALNKGFDGNKRRNKTRSTDENTECRYCHEMGHYIKDCPKLSDKNNNGRSSGNRRTPKRFSEFPSTSDTSDNEQPGPVRSYEDILNEDFPVFDENNKAADPLPDDSSFSRLEITEVSKTIKSLYPHLNLPMKATRKTELNNENASTEEDKVVNISPPVSKASVWGSNAGYICSKLAASDKDSPKIEENQMKDGFDSDEDGVTLQILK